MHRLTSTILAAVVLTVSAAACATTDGAVGAPAPSPTPTVSEPATPAPSETSPEPLAADWTAPFTSELGAGWTLRACLGDASDICVDRDGDEVGNLELAEYPLDAEEVDGEPLAVATDRAEDFLAFFGEDRAQGCADFTFEPEPVTPATVGGEPGVRTGFRLLTDDGTVVEQVINHFVVTDGVLFLVTTDAYALEGGCLTESEVSLEFEPHVLADFEGHVDTIVADTPLPTPRQAG